MESPHSLFSYFKKPLIIASIVFASTILFRMYVAYERYIQFNISKEKELINASNLVNEKVYILIDDAENAAVELGLAIQENGTKINFEEIAKKIIENHKSVSLVELAEGGLIKQIYPLQGNEKALGYNIFNDSIDNKELLNVLQNKNFGLLGPVPLIQGGNAVIGRLPIYLSGNFWGLSMVLISDSLFISQIQNSNIDSFRYQIQLSHINPNTGKEIFLLPNLQNFQFKDAKTIFIPEGNWKIYFNYNNAGLFNNSVVVDLISIALYILSGLLLIYLFVQSLHLRKQIEKQALIFEKEEKKNYSLFEQASDAFILTDLTGKFIMVNDSMCKMMGYSRNELLQMSVKDCIDPLQLEVDPIPLQQILMGKHNIRTRRLKKKNGEVFEVESNTKRISDDNILIIARDLSDIRKNEKKIAQSEALLNSAFDNSPIGLAICSEEGIWMKMNKSLCDIFGYPESYLVNTSMNKITFPDDISNDETLKHQTISGEIDGYQIKKRFLHKDGEIIWTNLRVALGESGDGQPLFFIIQIEDITSRKKADDEILRLSRLNNLKSKINELLLTNTKKEEILKHACNIAVEFGKFRMAWVGKYDENHQIIIPIAFAGIEDNFLDNLQIATNHFLTPDNGPINRALTTRSVQFCNDIANDIDVKNWRDEALKRNYQSTAALPIIVDDKMIAIIVFYMPEPFFFNETEISLLQNIADSLSFGLDKLRIANQQEKTEIALRNNSMINKAMINAFPDSIIRIKEDGIIVFVHSVNKSLLLDVHENLIGKHLSTVYPEETAKLILNTVREAFLTKILLTIEFTLNIGNITHYLEGRVISVDTPDDFQALLILRDITTTKESEKSLKNSLKLVSDFRYAMDQSSMVDIADNNFIINYVNDNFCKTTKYASAELIGKKHDILNSGYHDKAFFQSQLSRIYQGYVWQNEVRERAKDGSYFWVDTTIVPFLDNRGKPYQFISFRKDITLRKEIESELKGSEEKFRTVVEQSLLNVFIFQKKKLIYINPRFEETIGYTKDELLNKIHFLDLIHPNDRKLIEENLQLRISGSYVKNYSNYRAIKKDGSIIHIEMTSSLIEYNHEPAIIGTALDVTEKVAEEFKIARAVSNAQENERMLIGMELHDNVKQLLVACNISISLAKKKLDDKVTAEIHLNHSSEILLKAMTDLRYLSHQLTPLLETDLPMEDSIRMLTKSMNIEAFVKLSINCNQNNTIIPKQIHLELYRVLQEQLNNILKYSKANKIEIAFICNTSEILMSIKDDGQGFDTERKSEGIGLENIKRRTLGLNGQLEIISSIGNGCEIKINIPI